jgi:hypothetical protein
MAVGAVAAALVAAFVLLGDDDSPGVALADAAERIEGESMRQRILLRYGDSTGRYEITGQGVSSADGSHIEFDTDVAIKGQGKVRTLMRSVGDDYWFRYPEFDSEMPRGKRWVHMVDKTTAPTTLTPSEFAKFLTEADEVSEIGEERVLGQQTTEYQGMIDLEELADEIGGETKERLERGLEAENFPEDKRPGLAINAYISENGFPVRLRVWAARATTTPSTSRPTSSSTASPSRSRSHRPRPSSKRTSSTS